MQQIHFKDGVTAIGLLRQKYHQPQAMETEANPVIKIVTTGIVAWGLDSGGD